MIRILQVVGKMHRAGMETLVMNIYRRIDRTKLQFDFCVHSDEPGDYDQEIREYGGHIYHMPKAGIRNFIRLQQAAEHFFSVHSEFAAVHVHYSCVGCYYFKAAARAGITNLIYHAHNSGREPGLKALLRYAMERRSVKSATIRFACSARAARYNFGHHSYIMLNNGIDTERFRYSEEKRNDLRNRYGMQNKIICIHIGRFDTQKNHGFLLDLFEYAWTADRRMELLLLGDGPLKGPVTEKAGKLASREHIHFLGNVKHVEDFLSAADVFLLPSLYEGLPLTLIEAQASGIRCLVSDRITKEAVVTEGLVKRCPLDGIERWERRLRELTLYDRTDTSSEVRKAGFDSARIAAGMEQYYMTLGEKQSEHRILSGKHE